MAEQNNQKQEQNQQTVRDINISNCVRNINYCGDQVVWDISLPQTYQNYYYIPYQKQKKQENK